MSDTYTPSTMHVRSSYNAYNAWDGSSNAEFERWLTQHDKELRESIAQEIEVVDPVEWALAGEFAGEDAARIVRGES